MEAKFWEPVDLVDWILSRQVHDYLDSAGRPIGEGRSSVFQEFDTEMRSCPYAGTRFHHAKPMNATALQQLPSWPQILTMLGWLSQRYRMRRGSGVTTSNDLAQVTSAGVFLVDYLALRRPAALHSREIPVLISGLYKVCLGFQLAYLPERFSDLPAELPDAGGFLDYLEDNQLLIGEAEVCSGSPAMITQAYDAILSPLAIAPESLPSPCDRLEIDWEEFDAFSDHAGAIWQDLTIYAIRMPEFVPQLTDPLLPQDVRDRFNALLHHRGNQILDSQKGLLVEIARGVQAVSPPPSPVQTESLPFPEPGSLSATVLDWLKYSAAGDVQTHATPIASAIRAHLDAYDLYEAEVLAGVNQHLCALMGALRLGPGPPLNASALSRLCGRTLRDWNLPQGER